MHMHANALDQKISYTSPYEFHMKFLVCFFPCERAGMCEL